MANDYIKRQAALNIVCSDDCVECPDGGCDKYRWIKRLPAADVVEVVRCRDCKKVVLEDRGNGKTAFWCPVNRNYRCCDEFCNRGERRDAL